MVSPSPLSPLVWTEQANSIKMTTEGYEISVNDIVLGNSFFSDNEDNTAIKGLPIDAAPQIPPSKIELNTPTEVLTILR